MMTMSGYAILSYMPKLDSLFNLLRRLFNLSLDALSFIRVSLRARCAMAAENLFLRKQLALYSERNLKPRRAKAATKLTLVLLSRLFAWREALTVVKPDTLIRWHRKGFQLFWRWKSKARGRPRIPADLQKLIMHMAANNVTLGRGANRRGTSTQVGHSGSDAICPFLFQDHSGAWLAALETFVRNHAAGPRCSGQARAVVALLIRKSARAR